MQAALARPLLRTARSSLFARPLSTTRVALSDGDTGAPGARGSMDGSNAFKKREAASEGLWVKQQEQEKLLAHRQKLKEQNKSTEEVDKHLADLEKSQAKK